MIQRLQSLFLLIAGILNFIVFFSPLYRHAVNDPSMWIGKGFAGVLTCAMLIAAGSILLYANRKNQLKWVRIGIGFQVASLAAGVSILFTLGGFGSFLIREAASTGLLVLALALYLLADRFIRNDEELVKSMDRIR